MTLTEFVDELIARDLRFTDWLTGGWRAANRCCPITALARKRAGRGWRRVPGNYMAATHRDGSPRVVGSRRPDGDGGGGLPTGRCHDHGARAAGAPAARAPHPARRVHPAGPGILNRMGNLDLCHACGHIRALHATWTGQPWVCVGYRQSRDCTCPAFVEPPVPVEVVSVPSRSLEDHAARLKQMLVLPPTATPENMPRPDDAAQPGDGEVTTTVVTRGENYLCIQWGMRGVGFGELTLGARCEVCQSPHPASLTADTECMGADDIAKILRHAADQIAAALVATDTPIDRES